MRHAVVDLDWRPAQLGPVAHAKGYRHRDASYAQPEQADQQRIPAPSTRTGDEAHSADLSHLDAARRRAAVLTALGISAELGALLSMAESQGVSGARLQLLSSAIISLEFRDAASGGGAALDVAVTLHDHLNRWLQHVAPGLLPETQQLYCELSALIGWLAYDAGKPSLAKQYVSDAIAMARITDATGADLRAMNTMCLLLSDSGRPHQALQCVEAARRVADSQATPRTRALLQLRGARTPAKLGDAANCQRELVLAEEWLKQAGGAPSADDPPWVRFLDELELAATIGGCFLLLGQPDRAIESYRTAVEGSQSTASRNTTSRAVWLAEAFLRQGDVALASSTALGTVAEVSRLSSARVVRRLHRFRRSIDRYTASTPMAADFAEAYDRTLVT